jgi:hypothetical protein
MTTKPLSFCVAGTLPHFREIVVKSAGRAMSVKGASTLERIVDAVAYGYTTNVRNLFYRAWVFALCSCLNADI